MHQGEGTGVEIRALENFGELPLGSAEAQRAPDVLLEARLVAADRHRSANDHLTELRRQRALAHRGELIDALVSLEEIDVDLGHEPQPVGYETAPPLPLAHNRLCPLHPQPLWKMNTLRLFV